MPKRSDDDLPVPAPDVTGEGQVESGSERRSSSEPKRKPGPQSPESKARASAAGKRGRQRQLASAKLRGIEESIAGAVGKTGSLVMPWAPMTGGYCVRTADEIAGIVTKLAEGNPHLLAYLAKSETALDYAALAGWGFGLVVAVLIETGRIPVDSPIGEPYDMAGLYEEVSSLYGTEEPPADADVAANGHGSSAPSIVA